MTYGYLTKGCCPLIRRVGKKWELLLRDEQSAKSHSVLFDSANDAARAVGAQKTGFAPWDNRPDIPLDVGDLDNWKRRS